MKRTLSILTMLIIAALLSGCIISKTPSTNNVTMTIGEQMTFSVKVFPSKATYAWTLDGASLSNTGKSYGYTAEAGEHILTVNAKHILVADTQTWNIHVSSPITLNIISPAQGETIDKPSVMVKGTFTNATGNETGITVNGSNASVLDNTFTIDSLALPEGDAAITVKAVDTQGYTTESSITVHVAIAEKYLKLESDPDMGISPLEARLKLSGSFNYLTPELTYSGPSGGQVEVLEQRENDYRVRLTGPGVYSFSVSAKDDQGQIYTDNVAITVMDKEVLAATLNTKWEAMQNALLLNDVEAAVKDFSPETKDSYQNAIASLTPDQLSQLTGALGNAQFIGLKGDIAEYDLRTVIDGKEYSFLLAFKRDANGIWKILSF